MSTSTNTSPPCGPTVRSEASAIVDGMTSPSPVGSPGINSTPVTRRIEFDWAPGSGVPAYPFGSAEERINRERLHRTTLLFHELEQQVQDCLKRKRAHDAREAAESFRIAMAHPLKAPTTTNAPATVDAPATVQPVLKRMRTGEWHAVFETADEQAVQEQEAATPKAEVVEAIVCGKKAAARLPLALKHSELEAAYAELPKGAKISIEASLKCWRERRLDLPELLTTFKSFQSQSPVLQRALSKVSLGTEAVQCEVATPEQMRELSALCGV
jgi:hypothetical protein